MKTPKEEWKGDEKRTEMWVWRKNKIGGKKEEGSGEGVKKEDRKEEGSGEGVRKGDKKEEGSRDGVRKGDKKEEGRGEGVLLSIPLHPPF